MDNDLTLPPVFQRWQISERDGEVSFEAAQAEVPTSLWNMELPGDLQDAEAQLTALEAQLQATQSALEDAPERLAGFVDRLETAGGVEYTLEAYPAGAIEEQPAEAALLYWLEATQPGEVSFEVGTDRYEEMRIAASKFQEAVSGLVSQLVHLAKVETRQGGQLVAQSLVSWSGDTNTSWVRALVADEQSLHRRSLALAITSRLALLRMVVTAVQGAVKIAALVAAPGGALLALPAAWKYLNALISLTAETQSTQS